MKEQIQTIDHTNPWLFAAKIGLYGGFIWGGMYIIAYFLGFTKVIPGFLVEPFFKHDFLASWTGHMIGWLGFFVLTLVASFVYTALFRKVKGPWLGFGYGLAWWALLFGLGPFLKMMKPIYKLDLDTLITTACIFIIWGSFIGYTITIEFTDDRLREPFKTKN